MKKIFLTFVFLGQLFAQQQFLPIYLGKGYKNIKIGMSIDKLVTILGEPEKRYPKQEEIVEYEKAGYSPNKSIELLIPFQEVCKFKVNEYLVWKVYLNKNKVIYINISSYQAKEEAYQRILLNGSIKFFDTIGQVTKILGKVDVKLPQKEYEELVYTQKGVHLYFEEDQLRSIGIFKPIKGKNAEEKLKTLRKKS